MSERQERGFELRDGETLRDDVPGHCRLTYRVTVEAVEHRSAVTTRENCVTGQRPVTRTMTLAVLESLDPELATTLIGRAAISGAKR